MVIANKNMITQDQLKTQIHYNPEAGVFRRLTSPNNGKTKVGDVAGYDRPTVSGKKYTVIKIHGFAYRAGRLAWFYMSGQWPENIIDHIDGDGTNNKFKNLRDVTLHENCKNTRKRSDNKSGVCGVSWSKLLGKWNSYIWVNKKMMVIGFFDDFFEAVCSRKNAEAKYGYHSNHGKERPL